jgi:hypothetical protein
MKSLILIAIVVGFGVLVVGGLGAQVTSKKPRFDNDDYDDDDDDKNKYVPSPEEAPVFHGV